MTLEKSLETILAMEREGRFRVEEAERKARNIREEAREEAERLIQKTEEQIRAEKEHAAAEEDREVRRTVRKILDGARRNEQRLRELAERRRDDAASRTVRWLGRR